MWILSCVVIGIPTALQTYHSSFDCDRSYCHNKGCCYVFREEFKFIVLWILFFCFGAAFGIIVCEIVGFAPIAAYMYLLEHERHIGSSIKSQYAKAAFDFIFKNKSLHKPIATTIPLPKPPAKQDVDSKDIKNATAVTTITTTTKTITTTDGDKKKEKESPSISQVEDDDENNRNYNCEDLDGIGNKILLSKDEQLFRLIFLNYCWIGCKYFGFYSDKILIEYLQKEIDNEWSNVSLATLGRNNHNSDEFSDLWSLFYGPFRYFPPETKKNLGKALRDTRPCKCCFVFYQMTEFAYVYFMLYVFLPIFVLSRLFSIFFPLIAVIYFNFDFESIQLLQWILTILYAIFVGAWIIAAIRCFYFYHWTIRLFPGLAWWSPSRRQKGLNLMQKYYNHRLTDKFMYDKRRTVVIEILGKDIGGLVVSFWPKFEFKQWLTQLENDLKLCN